MNEAPTVRFGEKYGIEKNIKSSERGLVCTVRDGENLKRFIYREFDGESEAYRRLEKADSAYLPKVEAVEEEGGRVFVLEEYIHGDTLSFLLENGKLTEEQAHKITEQIALALSVLHGVGVVHRDVKPENVIMRGDEAVLIDFDASRVSKEEQNMDTCVMGTAGYAAPEQYGYSQTDARADIYALGVLLNIMLTGQHPSKKLASGRYLPIISKCIEVNVDRRYSDVGELLSALEKVSPKRSVIRKIALAVAAVMGITLIAVGAASMIKSPPEQNEPMPPPAEDTAPDESNNAADEIEIAPENIALEFKADDVHSAMAGYRTEGQMWTGDIDGHVSTFSYDLDGDGVYEKYVFGVSRANFNYFENLIQSLHRGIADYEEVEEYLAPCVWRLDGEELVLVPEFSVKLKKQEIRIWRTKYNETGIAPVLLVSGNKTWQGAKMFYLTADNYGEWIVEAVAEIDGVQVSGAAVVRFYSRSSLDEGENTDAYHTPQFGYEFGSTWVGDGAPFRSFFDYDLDGDGVAERYALGLTFYDEEQYGVPLMRMHYLIFDGDWLAQKIVPGVWRCEDNGRLTFMPEFADILENTQIRFWRGFMADVPMPDVSLTDDGPWSAMASIYATNEHTDNWIFELVTEINGEPIAAASVILCDVARDK